MKSLAERVTGLEEREEERASRRRRWIEAIKRALGHIQRMLEQEKK